MTTPDPQQPMRPEARLRYTAATARPRHELPGGASLAVWPVINVENWLIDNPMPRQALVAPTGAPLLPDVPNWAWHEYGMRVGFWRLLEAFASRGIRPTLSINASVVEAYAPVAAAARDAGWEFMGHGWVQTPTHKVADQRAMIARAVETLAGFTGDPVVGWLGPGLTETLETPDLLAEAGIRYVGDWVVDDLPARLTTAHGPLLTMPYSVELNDVPVIAVQGQSVEVLTQRAAAQTDRLIAEAARPGPLGGARVMGFALHPYLSGVPHRIAAIEAMLDGLLARPEVAFMQGRDLAAWYEASGDPA